MNPMAIEHFKLGVQPSDVTQRVKFLYLSKTNHKAFASLITVPFEPATQREKQ